MKKRYQTLIDKMGQLFREEVAMSAYNTDDYEFSFAERTIKNLETIQNIVEEERRAGKQDKDIKDAFEVTQLINSFVGLLIIPRQMCFKYMSDDISFPVGSAANELFSKIKNDPEKCEDTYFKQVWDSRTKKYIKTNEIEKVTPKILALRLRNAVSHDHLIIQPISPGKDGVITGIEFSDKPARIRDAKKEYFRLALSISETEILVRALSELLLSCYPQS